MIVSLVSTLRITVAWNIAQPINLLADFAAALSRIQGILEFENGDIHKYLQYTFTKSKPSKDYPYKDNHFPSFIKNETMQTHSSGTDPAILLRNVVCSWTNSWNRPILKSLGLSAEKGDLVFITSPVGCGKTSLLNAILGEIPLLAGDISCQGKIAWVSQQPWVFSGTVRDNILFGETFDSHRYCRTLHACDLQNDLQSFPNGDMTLVGERGIVLSGGQRARVELARAVYSNADIYLLDDPLSAVDTKVGHRIYNKCIIGLLRDKTRLMVTHNVHVLKDTRNIVVMKTGSVLEKGNSKMLLKSALHPSDKGWCAEKKKALTLQKKNPLVEDQSEKNTAQGEESANLDDVDEDRVIGSISWKLYWRYIQTGMCAVLAGVVVMFFFFVQGRLERFFFNFIVT